MSANDVTKLRRYCAENFAASAVFADSPERASAALAEVVWLATRDRTRAVTSHRRSARAVAASSCVADDAVLQGSRALRGAARAGDTTPRSKEDVDEDPNVKVIVLGNSHRGGAASSFSFEVLR